MLHRSLGCAKKNTLRLKSLALLPLWPQGTTGMLLLGGCWHHNNFWLWQLRIPWCGRCLFNLWFEHDLVGNDSLRLRHPCRCFVEPTYLLGDVCMYSQSNPGHVSPGFRQQKLHDYCVHQACRAEPSPTLAIISSKDALVPQSLYVSLTWTAGILEICCSLRAKKNGYYLLQGLDKTWLFLSNDFAWCKFWLRWWILLSNVNGWPRVGHLCLIGYIGYGISGEGHLSVWEQTVSRRVSRHVSRHVCHSCFPVLGVMLFFALVGACVFVLVLFPRRVVDDFFFDLVLAGTWPQPWAIRIASKWCQDLVKKLKVLNAREFPPTFGAWLATQDIEV